MKIDYGPSLMAWVAGPNLLGEIDSATRGPVVVEWAAARSLGAVAEKLYPVVVAILIQRELG